MNLLFKRGESIVTWCREEFFRQPVQLRRILSDQPESCRALRGKAPSIGLGSVMAWQEWNRHDSPVSGWQCKSGQYQYSETHIPELSRLCRKEDIPEWSCDIQDVEGVYASKSELGGFSDLDSWVESKAPHLIENISVKGLSDTLAHHEIRILNGPPGADNFRRHTWDGRLFLMNDGGSHHFAAARYMAKRLGKSVPLTGSLVSYSIDPDAMQRLRDLYDIFALPETLQGSFHEAMESIGATYFWIPFPPPCKDQVFAVLLPRDERIARRASAAMRKTSTFDLVAHLAAISC